LHERVALFFLFQIFLCYQCSNFCIRTPAIRWLGDALLGNGQVSQFVKITVIGIFGTRKGNGVAQQKLWNSFYRFYGRTSGMGARRCAPTVSCLGVPRYYQRHCDRAPQANSIRNRLPTALAAFTIVLSVTEVFSGSRNLSRDARLVCIC